MNRFKEFRRDKKPRITPNKPIKDAGSVQRRQSSKSPGITKSPSEPSLMPGEDNVSFNRHTKVLQVNILSMEWSSKEVVSLWRVVVTIKWS